MANHVSEEDVNADESQVQVHPYDEDDEPDAETQQLAPFDFVGKYCNLLILVSVSLSVPPSGVDF